MVPKDDLQYDAEKTKRRLKLSTESMQNNVQPFKSLVFVKYTGHLIPVPGG